MTKTALPLHADDLTGFVRALSRQLGETSPSHLKLMNMVARAAGFQNVQHMRSANAALRRIEARTDQAAPDMRSVERALRLFDAQGRLEQWHSKRAVQTISLWVLWSALPSGEVLQEPELNALLIAEHCFDDPAILRRTMISCGLLTRQRDGTDYQRVEREPPPEAKAAIRVIASRRRARLM